MNSCNFSPLLLSILLLLTFFNHTKAATQISYPPPPYYNCSTNSTYEPNSTYHANLQTLLSWLSSNATATAQIYSTSVAEGNTTTSSNNNSNNIYGLFMCRIGDGEPNCKDCVINSTVLITELCPSAKEAMLWAENCFVRYSDRYFFTTVEESPKRTFMNGQDYVGQVGRFNSILWNTMNDVRNLTAGTPVGSMKYGYKSENITANQTLYAIGWCIPYLSSENCSWCLSNAIAEITAICCKGKIGGRVVYPSCGIRYELYLFYHTLTSETLPQVPNTPAPPRPLAPSGKGKQSVLVIVLVVPVVVSVVLLSLISCSCFLSNRKRKNHETILKESFGNEVAIMESLWFDLGQIESATNKFATENMIGKGGFGEVYKGVISNGQEIAVKRLLGSSGQGEIEFKNEVLVIAQLQHKNLVKLRGFCLDGQEKILIYEYVHNKSLDYFLFDSRKRRQLNWSVRHNIIKGIARGILYLHEDSRLKIIHRDLKPSNVLLDSNMNPKISDFGIAKIVAADNMEENTHRIIGTYGYMSPEYAMHGQFSVKSDVYSFGVMLLEIMSGKRKGSPSVSDSVDDIRKYALTKWRERMPLELLDSKLEGSYSENEVIRCIHIGLLCVEEDPSDRPTMAEVVSFLNNPSVDLPMPTEQNIKKEDILGKIGLDSSSDSNYESISLMTTSQCYPR